MQLLKPGVVFSGRYRVERLLARGGHGVVYIAEQLSTEAIVALKVLSPALVESPDAMGRFALEAKVAGRVRSDFIVKVLDAGRDDDTGLPYLVMELLDGESLEALVVRVGPLDAERVCTYLAQVASGLDRAHGYVGKDGRPRPIIHRDLKPENLFVARRETGDCVVKILDFGIAKVVSETAHQSQGTKGTPLYMAYEQLTGNPPTPATDVWALGLIAFFLLTGKSYWTSASKENVSISAVFSEILQSDLTAASKRAVELGCTVVLPAAFDEWFSRCVHRTSSARFATAGAAAGALAEAMMGAAWAATLPVGTPLPAPPSGAQDEGDAQVAVSRTKPEAPRPTRRAVRAALVGLSAACAIAVAWSTVSSRNAATLTSETTVSSQPLALPGVASLRSSVVAAQPSQPPIPNVSPAPGELHDAGTRRPPSTRARVAPVAAPSAVSPYDRP